MTIKAIETSYKGCRFRSRLEARWAVFLDTWRVGWEYEPQGFTLDGECYLPDFFLPFPQPVLVGRESAYRVWDGWRNRQAYWLEIKPDEPTARERNLMLALARETKHHVYCFAGDCAPESLQVYVASIGGHWWNQTCQQKDFEQEMQQVRAEVGLPPASRVDPLTVIWFTLHGFSCNLLGYDGPTREEDELAKSFLAARSARFEHGERG